MKINYLPSNSLFTDVPPPSEKIGVFSEGGGTSVHRLPSNSFKKEYKLFLLDRHLEQLLSVI